MKNKLLTVFLCAAIFSHAQVQENTIEFDLIRQNDKIDISVPQNTYQRFKQISIGDSTTLSFGGSYRFQAESFIHESFVEDFAPTNHWFLHRAMLHTHLKLGSKFQVFAELNSSTASNKEHTSPVDKDEFNVNQLFAQYDFNPKWQLLVGRQNLRLGGARLVDVREGPNVRLSFDMAEIQYHDKHTTVKGFYSVPVQQKQGVLDNETLNFDENFSAVYWTQQWSKNTNTDLYLLYKEEANKSWSAEPADDKRASIGLRTFGDWNGITYNNEFIYQLGKFGEKDIHAWTVSFNLEKDFLSPHPFAFGVKAEAISGDEEKDDHILNTFDGMYPRGAYFGRVAYFGPSNLIDVHPYVSSEIGDFGIEMDYVAFWRYSTNDGIYNPALMLSYPTDNDKKFLAHQIGAIMSYPINKYISLEGEANIIYPGEYLKQLGNAKTLYHFVLTTEFKF